FLLPVDCSHYSMHLAVLVSEDDGSEAVGDDEGGVVSAVKLVELTLPEGGSVLVRAESVEGEDGDQGPRDIGFGDTMEALPFAQVSSAVRGVAAEIHQALQSVQPDRTEVEFGLELAVRGSRLVCLLADGEAKATLSVRLEWLRQPSRQAE